MVTKVYLLGIKLVLYFRCLSCQSELIDWAPLHPASRHHLSRYPSMPVEGELYLLGLTRMKHSMQWKNIKHL